MSVTSPIPAPLLRARLIGLLTVLLLAALSLVVTPTATAGQVAAQAGVQTQAQVPSGHKANIKKARKKCLKKNTRKARVKCLKRLKKRTHHQPVQPVQRDPRLTRGLFVDPLMPAAQAGATYARIGGVAQALWITDYYSTPAAGKRAVVDYATRANRANKTPMMSIYAIPGRDCGLHSAGGLPTNAAYLAWIREVAAGMKGQHAIVILEPDAVPFMGNPSCTTDPSERQELLTEAARLLTANGAWVYIDAGHSAWRPPAEMATLLRLSGMRYARGFSTNVGNFRKSADELAYARAVNANLASQGLPNRRYVIETARNGASPAPSPETVCNPVEARIGAPPRLVFSGALDGYLWIKHPGESDGPCNGGPASGVWWPEGAQRLLS